MKILEHIVAPQRMNRFIWMTRWPIHRSLDQLSRDRVSQTRFEFIDLYYLHHRVETFPSNCWCLNFLWDHLWLFLILWGWIIVIFDKSRTFLQHYPQVNIQDIGYIKTGRWLWNILIPDPVLITFRPHRGRTCLILKTVPLAGQTSHLITSSLASFPPALTENLLLLF